MVYRFTIIFHPLHGNLGAKTWDSPKLYCLPMQKHEIVPNCIVYTRFPHKIFQPYHIDKLMAHSWFYVAIPDIPTEAPLDIEVVTASKATDLAHLEPLEPWLQAEMHWLGEHPEVLRKKFNFIMKHIENSPKIPVHMHIYFQTIEI